MTNRMSSPEPLSRDAMEWAAKQITRSRTVDRNRPDEIAPLWLDRAAWWPEIAPRHPRARYGPIRITTEMWQELRRLRDAAGLSAAVLCRKIGIDQTYLSGVEHGNITRTDAETWHRLHAECRATIAERVTELQRIQQEWEAA